MTDEEYRNIMQVGITDEMKGVKMKLASINYNKEDHKIVIKLNDVEIWNEAIEAAVNLDIDLSYEQIHQIRKLKK